MQFDFESMKNTIVSAGKEMGDKAKEASGLAKMKLDIRTKEEFLQKQYAELGRLYYNSQTKQEAKEENAEETTTCFEENEDVKACMESIHAAEEEIKDLNFQILNTKGAVVCPNCGLTQEQGNAFCKSCGTKLGE